MLTIFLVLGYIILLYIINKRGEHRVGTSKNASEEERFIGGCFFASQSLTALTK